MEGFASQTPEVESEVCGITGACASRRLRQVLSFLARLLPLDQVKVEDQSLGA